MREIRTELEIDAPPAHVWDIPTDFEAYEVWNPFVTSVNGGLNEGTRLTERLEPPGGRGMTFKPRLLRCNAPRELRWLGKLVLPRVFDGEHILEPHPLDGGRTQFVQREEFSGILVRPLLGMAGKSTRDGFVAMNAALKARAEAR